MIITYITHLALSKITVSAHWKSESVDKVREIGQFIYEDKWAWHCINEDFTDLKIEDLNIENLAFYTPPTLSNIGVIIPEKFEWVFANDRFEINGFVVDFARVNGALAVDVAYLAWEAFQNELDLPTNATVKASLLPIWEYVEIEFENGNIIKL